MGEDKVTIRSLYKTKGGNLVINEYITGGGMVNGKKLSRILHAKGKVVFSVDTWGHVQEEDGPITEDEVIYLREGREFFLKDADSD